MKLQLILDTLKYGELANVYTEEKQNQIITFINLGLTSIYERFPVLEKQIAMASAKMVQPMVMARLVPMLLKLRCTIHVRITLYLILILQ